jgi:hypothetical protein
MKFQIRAKTRNRGRDCAIFHRPDKKKAAGGLIGEMVGDEGMTLGSSILAYLVFGPGRTLTKVIVRPTSMIVWHSPGARLEKT